MPADTHPSMSMGNKDFADAGVVIIGAGIGGLCTAIQLLKNNIRNFVILEKSSGLGGTWRDNTYPGCCCDVFSHVYSFSFDQNPDWTRLYPGQEEILNYLNDVADKHGLHRYIRFGSIVEEARWDEPEKKWKVQVQVDGAKDAETLNRYIISSDYLIPAVGQLNYPKYPVIDGIDDFKGKMMHSARWDWSYDYKGKRIAVIGNGATAAQIAPEVAPDASHLTVFQRTPNWVLPRRDMNVWKPVRAAFRYIPTALSGFRVLGFNLREASYALVADPESRRSDYGKRISQFMMKKQLPNKPGLWSKLTPDYPPGCKRVLLSDDYFPALARENVSLETGHIDRITEKGIVVDGTEQEFDLIVLATGFRSVEFLHPIKIIGDGGLTLSEIWKGAPRALYGIGVASMPNFSIVYGPNTNLGHNSVIFMMESQVQYIIALIKAVLKSKQNSTIAGQTLKITPKAERIESYNAQLQKALSATSFAHPDCSSWYKNEDGLITNNWPGAIVEYQKLLSKLDWEDFDMSGKGSTDFRPTTYLGRVREESMINYTAVGTVAGAAALFGVLSYKAPHLLPRLASSTSIY